MKIREIRSACVKIEYAGCTFLVDPWLKTKGEDTETAYDLPKGYAFQEELPQPMQDLPCPASDVLHGTDAYLFTSLGFDHVDCERDGAIGRSLNHRITCFTQSMNDSFALFRQGFLDTRVVGEGVRFREIRMSRVPGKAWTLCGDAVAFGDAAVHAVAGDGATSGVIFQHPKEPTFYLTGDTVYSDEMEEALFRYRPDVICANVSAKNYLGFGRTTMNEEDLWKIHQILPDAVLIAVGMDNVASMTLNRPALKRRLKAIHMLGEVRIPANGEILQYTK